MFAFFSSFAYLNAILLEGFPIKLCRTAPQQIPVCLLAQMVSYMAKQLVNFLVLLFFSCWNG